MLFWDTSTRCVMISEAIQTEIYRKLRRCFALATDGIKEVTLTNRQLVEYLHTIIQKR